MTPDPSLLLKAADAIEKEPKNLEMGSWARNTDCGTVHCAAGHIAVQAGWIPVFGDSDGEWNTAWQSPTGTPWEEEADELAFRLVGASLDSDMQDLYCLFYAEELNDSEVVAELRRIHQQMTSS